MYANVIWRIGNELENVQLIKAFIEQGLSSQEENNFTIVITCFNGYLKKIRDNKRHFDLKNILEEYFNKTQKIQNEKKYLLGLYQNIHKDIIGNLSKIDWEFILEKMQVLDERNQAFLYSSFCMPFWDEITKHIDILWNSMSEESKIITLGEIVDRITVFAEQYSFDINSDKIDWIINKTFSLMDLDSLKNYDYSYKRLQKISTIKYSFKWFMHHLNKRYSLYVDKVDEFKIKVIPRYFDIIRFVDVNLKNPELQDEISKFIDRGVARQFDTYRMWDLLVDIDSDGGCVGIIVAEKIDSADNVDFVLRLSEIGGYYKDTTKGWELISYAACKKAADFHSYDKKKIHVNLVWNGIRSYVSSFNEVAPAYYAELEHALEQLDKSDVYRKDYWKWQVQRAEYEIKSEVDECEKRNAGDIR